MGKITKSVLEMVGVSAKPKKLDLGTIDNYELPNGTQKAKVEEKEVVVKASRLSSHALEQGKTPSAQLGTMERELNLAIEKYEGDKDAVSLLYRLTCLKGDATGNALDSIEYIISKIDQE